MIYRLLGLPCFFVHFILKKCTFHFCDYTSWEKNDNFYFTASAIEGPWSRQGGFAPEGSLTFYSQTTFVLPLIRSGDTIPMFMGDRWSFPHQASAATYVWMPMQVDGEKLYMPEYWECWDIEKMEKTNPIAGGTVIPHNKYKPGNEADWKVDNGQLASNIKGSRLEVPFDGTRVAILGESNVHSGYARIYILDGNRKEVLSALVDFYSKNVNQATRFISPELLKDKYTLVIEVTGISPVWTDKSKARFGSIDSFVTINDVVVFNN